MPDREPDPILQELQRTTPEWLVKRLGPRINARMHLLDQVYQRTFASWPGQYLNTRILRMAVESYYCDLYRLKFFRNVEWADEHKKAAYTIKWLSVLRPIQIHRGAETDMSLLMVNGHYAVMAGLTLLDIKTGWKDDSWWVTYVANLNYLLHYHSPSVEQLSSEMCVLQTMDNARRLNPPKEG